MKLSFWTIVVCCLFIGLIPLTWVYFQVYQPYETASQNMIAYQEALKTQADKLPQAQKRVQKAIKKISDASAAWNQYALTKTPPNNLAGGGIMVNENEYQLVVDSPKFRNSAQRALNAQLRVGGVKIVSAPDIPPPTDVEKDILATYYNYPAFNFPVVLWELGSVTVTGTYAQIMANVRAWSNMPHYLAVVDGLRIDGTSPNLTASYNVTIVGYIQSNTIYPASPASGGAAASGTGGQGGGSSSGPTSLKSGKGGG